ncbi:hypothetical protein KVH30_02295 [Streptomyces olivaceus]|uniref:hypothetical protein n=1 Tax=Streptomyces olivaceus TaxID=47716 RepID=UPI001CC9E00D|nr:hypothetical protein [Streptomyces olivaceus]MBZ6290403.1 hypothetical protein [Streptomyces olivaceus]MBZ6324355.1 hypothetical protein [Streptomyces olivaceus]
MARSLSAKAARAILDAAEIVKAPDWSETRRWYVVSGGRQLLVIEPSYGGTSRAGRNGWIWWLAEGARMRNGPEPTREKAAIAGLAAWQRWVTRKETP